MMSERRRSVSSLSSNCSLTERPPPSYNNNSLDDFASSTTPLNISQPNSDVQQKDTTSYDERNNEVCRTKPPSVLNITDKKRLLHFDWWWELGAFVVATICIVAITIVLININNKPIKDLHFAVQPATLIAIFSTIAKSSLLVPLAACLSQLKWSYFEKPRSLNRMQDFEDASRGPWGSMMLLWKVKGTTLLASMGALVTLLTLAFEPFTQQVIHFESRKILMERNYQDPATSRYVPARIPAAMSLSDLRFKYGAEDVPKVRLSMTLGMIAAIAEKSSTFQFNTSCPTAYCSFQDFTTLGACSTCDSEDIPVNNAFGCTYYVRESVPDTSTQNDTRFSDLQSLQAAIREGSNRNSIIGYGMNCSHTKEGYPTIGLSSSVNTVENTTSYIEGLGHQQNETSENLSSNAIFGERLNGYQFFFNQSDGKEYPTGQSTYRFCTSGYRRKGIGGNNDDFDTINTYTCLTTSDNINNISNLDRYGEFNATLTYCRVRLCAREYKNVYVQDQQLKADSIANRSLIVSGFDEESNDMLVTPEGLNSSSLGQSTFPVGPKNMAQLATTIENATYSLIFQEFIKDLVEKSDWQLAIEHITESMSEYLLSSDNPIVSTLSGVPYSFETFIRIRWIWLFLPLLIFLLSIATFICTIIESNRKRFIFKHSILAPILPRLKDGHTVELHTVSSGRQTDDDLLKLASNIRVTLTKSGEGTLGLERKV